MSNTLRATSESPQLSLRGDVIVGNRGLLRVEEAAQWLGMGRTKAYELVYRGTLLAAPVFGHRTAELCDDGSAEFGGDDRQRWGGRYELR